MGDSRKKEVMNCDTTEEPPLPQPLGHVLNNNTFPGFEMVKNEIEVVSAPSKSDVCPESHFSSNINERKPLADENESDTLCESDGSETITENRKTHKKQHYRKHEKSDKDGVSSEEEMEEAGDQRRRSLSQGIRRKVPRPAPQVGLKIVYPENTGNHFHDGHKTPNIPDYAYYKNEMLLKYLLQTEEENRVFPTSKNVRAIQPSAESIVRNILNNIEQVDARFKCNLIETGSFYDGVKVGQADEFDFMAEVQILSNRTIINVIPTSEAGFVHLVVQDPYVRRQWGDLTEKVCAEHHILLEDGQCVKCTKRIQGHLEVLHPQLVQKRFRELVDAVLEQPKEGKKSKITLPPNWEYGGYNRPHFSGHRRHGPATLLQFVVTVDDMEIKVCIDLTLAVHVPLPVEYEKFKFSAFKHCYSNHLISGKLRNALLYGPGIHVIPLYSKLMLSMKKFCYKDAWRISCNMLEKEILSCSDDLGVPKKLLRVLKILRDQFLTWNRQKPKRKQKVKGQNKGKGGGQNTTEAQERKSVICTEQLFKKDKSRSRSADINVTQTNCKQSGENTCVYEDIERAVHSDCDDENAELTEVEEKSVEEAMADYSKYRSTFEMHEVEYMHPMKGSGEYYGPSTLIHSIEFKTIVIRLLAKHPEPEFWKEDKLPAFVCGILNQFKISLSKRETMASFFFDTLLCSPANQEKRQNALAKLEDLLIGLNEIAQGVRSNLNHLAAKSSSDDVTVEATVDIHKYVKVKHRNANYLEELNDDIDEGDIFTWDDICEAYEDPADNYNILDFCDETILDEERYDDPADFYDVFDDSDRDIYDMYDDL